MAEQKSILIVDDEVFSGKILQTSLREMGFLTDYVVATGEEAIELTEKVEFDLILMDIMLAGDIDGIEAGRIIRSRSKIPIIYLTSHVDERYVERAKRTEPVAYLLKPFRLTELRMHVEMALLRAETERLLRESEQRYRALVETQVELVCRYKPDGTLTYVNHAYCIYYGLSREQLLGSKTGLPEVKITLGKIAFYQGFIRDSGSVQSFETQDVGLDGEPRYQQWTEVKLLDEYGRLQEIQGVGRDITELKRLEAETLYRTEERFQAVFDSVADGIFILDNKLNYTHVNPAGRNLFGFTQSQVVGFSPQKVFGREIGSKLEALYSRVLAGSTAQYEQTRTISGTDLNFSESVAPLKNIDGSVIGLCCICRNISGLKKVDDSELDEQSTYMSLPMRQTIALALAAAESEGVVCLLGESGSGKDHLARWIHDHSRRRSGPFVSINCAVLPETLVESELFGHERGAFTGALVQKRGLLELAEGGTILLNEIGELSGSIQAKLLSFIDTKSFMRVGGAKPITVDSRLIVATHRNLEEEVSEGRFMGPLFHRINVFPITVPPLRDRLEDIPTLCRQLIHKLQHVIGMESVPEFDGKHYRMLSAYNWPGNVRELRNVLERSLMLWKGGRLDIQLPVTQETKSGWSFSVDDFESHSLSEITSIISRSFCEEMVIRCKGNKSKAAKRLGVSRDALYRRLRGI